MARTLPAIDIITYDGFTFPPAIHSSVTVTPVDSSDGRNHKYSTYRIRVTGVLVASDLDPTQVPDPVTGVGKSLTGAFANNMNALRKKLLRSGKTLTVVGIGINATLTAGNCVGFGPKPKVFAWDMLGADQALSFTWEVEYTTSHCDSELFGSFAEFSYSVGFSISEEGLTTRVINGEYETHVYRQGNQIVGTADQQWDNLLIPRIPGFVRTHDHQLSPDKKTVRFTITDREHESDNPLYPGMIRMQVRESIRNAMQVIGGGNQRWGITISGSITVAPGVARSLAWTAFLIVFRDRFDQRVRAAGDANDGKGVVCLTGIELGEDIFNRTVDFSVSYTLFTSLDTLLAATGFGRPVPGDWNAWSVSLAELTGPRGVAGLRHYASDDVIVDFCGGVPIPAQGPVQKRYPDYDSPGISKNCPPPESSWYAYHWGLRVQKVASKVYGTTMGKYDPSTQKLTAGEPGDDSPPSDDEEPTGSGAPTSTSYSYSRGNGGVYVTLYGSAIRIGYHINIPNIKTIAGQPAGKPIWEDIEPSHVVGNAGGCKVYAARWKRTYFVKKSGEVVTDNIPTQHQKPDNIETPNQ